MERIVGTGDHVRARLEALHASGELVAMTPPVPFGRGQVLVRVQVRPLVKPTSTRTPTGPRQTTTRPRQRRWVRWAAAAAIAILLSGALFWVLFTYWALILGAISVALFLLSLLSRVAGGGGDDHPCNR